MKIQLSSVIPAPPSVIPAQAGIQEGAAQYNVDKLVYYEEYQYVQDAILREKQLKKWNRQWKIKLIEKDNPTWRDLFLDML